METKETKNKETKGLRVRPRSMVPSQEYRDNWDRIFKNCTGIQEDKETGSSPTFRN